MKSDVVVLQRTHLLGSYLRKNKFFHISLGRKSEISKGTVPLDLF